MALYLIDKQYSDLAIDLIKRDDKAKIVFIQDGVYLKISDSEEKKEIYYIEEDMESRGLKEIGENAQKISYDKLIDMIIDNDVYNLI